MNLDRLHHNQIRILKALEDAVAQLAMRDQLAIIDSLARYVAAEPKLPGDIDVFIDKPLCARYWDFMAILNTHGVISVYDLFDRPKNYEWRCCRSTIAHALSLTIDCMANVIFAGVPGFKHANLDIKVTPDGLAAIPNSGRWVTIYDPHDSNLVSNPANVTITDDLHDQLVNSLKKNQIKYQKALPVPGFNLDYRLLAP
jgi:hypothetical protein